MCSGGFLQSEKERKIKREKKDRKEVGAKREDDEGEEKRACNISHHSDHECLTITQISLRGFLPAPCLKPVTF